MVAEILSLQAEIFDIQNIESRDIEPTGRDIRHRAEIFGVVAEILGLLAEILRLHQAKSLLLNKYFCSISNISAKNICIDIEISGFTLKAYNRNTNSLYQGNCYAESNVPILARANIPENQKPKFSLSARKSYSSASKYI